MSETEHIVGKLIPVEIKTDLETTCKEILNNNGYFHDVYHDTYADQIKDDLYRQYIFIDSILYNVESEDVLNEDIYYASINKDKSINFRVCYYNGGCSFDDAIAQAIDNIPKKEIKQLKCSNYPDKNAVNESFNNPGTCYCNSCANYVAMEYGTV